MRLLRNTIAFILIATVFIGCTKSTDEAASTPTLRQAESLSAVDACFSSDSGNQAAIWYAQEYGLFEKYGLDVNLVAITSGSKSVAAMIANEVDFCQVAGSAVVNAVVAGEDLVIIGGLFNKHITSLVVTPEIKTALDLKGKAVAISKPGGSSDFAMRLLLEGQNLVPDKDVAVLAVGGQGARLAAMTTGEIAGTLVSPPNTLKAEQFGFSQLIDMSTLDIPYQHTSIASTRDYLAENPEEAISFMKAMIEAIAQIKQDQPGTIKVIAQYMSLDPEEDKELLNETYQTLLKKQLPKIPYPTQEGIQSLLTKLEEENPKASNFNPEDVMDIGIVDQLNTNGFIESIY